MPNALQRDKQIMLRQHLKLRGIDDPRMLDAMAQGPPRAVHRRVAAGRGLCRSGLGDRLRADDQPPYIVALMTQPLALRGDERVLEIGTGSGYQTAILAELAQEVVEASSGTRPFRSRPRRGWRN